MAHFLSKVLDAILANVELTIVNSQFNSQYLENCRGITGIIPADLKLILLSWRLRKMKKIEPWEF
jgi:hypothetical protein